MLTEKEIARYSRHLLLPEIGTAGQEKLKSARVLVLGAGGLGCPVLQYLAAAGIGKIGVLDFDKVDESNLQRQVLYDTQDVSTPKAEAAKQKLSRQNPLIDIESLCERLTIKNALSIFANYDLIVDGTDNFSTRYLVNDACGLLGKPFISGAIFKFSGQVSVFNFKQGPTYRCLFPAPPEPGSVPGCSETGVLGVLPGIIGTLMANEAIKLITGTGDLLSGKLLMVDALSLNFQTLSIKRNEEALGQVPKNAEEFMKQDYDLFCGLKKKDSLFKEISAAELHRLIYAKENIQLLDVRDKNELPLLPELKDLHIPLKEIHSHPEKISRDKKVIVFCRSGARSRKAIELLSDKFGFQNLYNLKGGAMEWQQVEKSLKND